VTDIWERLKNLIADQADVDEKTILLSTSLIDDLNFDSSDMAELITIIEEEFSTLNQKFQIRDEDTKEIVTVQDIIDCLRDYGI